MVRLKTQNDLEIALRQNKWLGEILERFEEVTLPDTWLVAGGKAHPAVPGWSICSMRVPCAGDQRRAEGTWDG